jgi:hypothetical protein
VTQGRGAVPGIRERGPRLFLVVALQRGAARPGSQRLMFEAHP